jgi:hypothetical protein
MLVGEAVGVLSAQGIAAMKEPNSSKSKKLLQLLPHKPLS